jgi:hypothetical protein
MFDLIARLRSKSIAQRRRIAFLAALCITAVILLMWLVWLMEGGFSARLSYATSTPETTPARDLWAPISGLLRSMSSGLDILKKL